MAEHISDKALRNYDEDDPKADQDQSIKEHLDSCPQCRNRLQVLRNEFDHEDEDSDSDVSESDADSVTYANLPASDQDANEAWTESTTTRAAGISELPPGYEMLGELGRGGMGVVLKARNISSGRLIALKLLLPAGLADGQARERLRREANTITKLQHPGIVRVFNVVMHQEAMFLELELVEGGVLSNFISQPLEARWSAAMLLQLAQAVSFFHERDIVHRDLKPDNVLLSSEPKDSFVWSPPANMPDVESVSVPRAKITDFGLAKQLNDDAALTAPGQILGTPLYMAPEQTERGGSKRFTKKVDLHALGCLLYELLTKHSPFKGKNVNQTLSKVRSETPPSPSTLVESVPSVLADICLKCLMKNPDDRYESAKDLAEDLDWFLQGKEGLRPKPNLVSRWLKRIGYQD